MERDLHQQDKMASLGKLISRVAHEVKTPLAVIKTRIQMWQRNLRRHGRTRSNSPVITDDAMELVVREIDRLSDLVRRLLVFSKPVCGTLCPTDVRTVIDRTVRIIQPAARTRHIRIYTALDNDVPPLLLDDQALEQVFLNICMNALDAMPHGGHLRVSTAVSPEDGTAAICICRRWPGDQCRHSPADFRPILYHETARRRPGALHRL